MKIIKPIFARDAVMDISEENAGVYHVELYEYARGDRSMLLSTQDLKKAKHYLSNCT